MLRSTSGPRPHWGGRLRTGVSHLFFKESIVGRLHSAIGYVTPIRKEQLAAAAQAVTRVHPTGGRSRLAYACAQTAPNPSRVIIAG